MKTVILSIAFVSTVCMAQEPTEKIRLVNETGILAKTQQTNLEGAAKGDKISVQGSDTVETEFGKELDPAPQTPFDGPSNPAAQYSRKCWTKNGKEGFFLYDDGEKTIMEFFRFNGKNLNRPAEVKVGRGLMLAYSYEYPATYERWFNFGGFGDGWSEWGRKRFARTQEIRTEALYINNFNIEGQDYSAVSSVGTRVNPLGGWCRGREPFCLTILRQADIGFYKGHWAGKDSSDKKLGGWSQISCEKDLALYVEVEEVNPYLKKGEK